MLSDLHNLAETSVLNLGRSQITVGGLITGLLIVLAGFVLARLARIGLGRLRGRAGRGAASVYIIERLATYGLIIFGVIIGLQTVGLNLSSLALPTSALFIGIGLGLQGVVKEFVSGLFLIFDRQLSLGDYIELENGMRGLVQEIGPRATRICTNDNINVLVPNSKLIELPVINWTLNSDTRRVHIPFPVAYGADKEKVRTAVLAAAKDLPFTMPDTDARKTQVWLVGFADSALKFELVLWPTLEAAKRPQAMHAAYTWAIEDALRRAGIEMPLPQRELRARGLFGEEGEAAIETLGLKPVARGKRGKAAAASSNDASEAVDAPEPIDAPEPGP